MGHIQYGTYTIWDIYNMGNIQYGKYGKYIICEIYNTGNGA
jgi:hypothetical protein